MRTGRDVAIAALLGAEEFGFCTAVLVTQGCVMLRHCHLNNCSLGVATQDDILQNRFAGKPEYIINYFTYVTNELREIMASLGMRKLDDMIGRVDLLEQNAAVMPWKAQQIDFSRILYQPVVPKKVQTHQTIEQHHAIDAVLDRELITRAAPALRNREPVVIEMPIRNNHRTAGAMLSGAVCRTYGEQGLNDDTIHCKFTGVAGQSFGAFLARGVTFELEGMANDYVGKGISGGKIIVYPSRGVTYPAAENIVIGNTTFYGAIAGEAYICGKAGERFGIRNSGLYAVVEGLGDHGCEYMTGGVVAVLGRTGRNFGAGMSGGVAYVYDEDESFKSRCNMGMIELEKLDAEDVSTLRTLLHNHARFTGSALAKTMLENFPESSKKFIKVLPMEYKNILKARAIEKNLALDEIR
jgi:glutamate synthase domain-containing protein 3